MQTTMNTILFYLGHPAHYYNVSIIIKLLNNKGYNIVLISRNKDILFDLIKTLPYRTKYLNSRNGTSKLVLIKNIISREFILLRMALKYKPKLVVGTDIVITHVGKLLNIPSIIFNEDDAKEVPYLANYGFKYANVVLSPICCNINPYQNKKINYNGFNELAYLHPKYFSPNVKIVKRYLSTDKPYFLLRFAKLTAHHDKGVRGISTNIANKLIHILKSHGNIFITSERELEPEFEKYRLNINPIDIHHVMAYAKMYIGDSQTMAAEAAVLGVPSIRFNDFVGKLGYLEELEHKYGLTFGINPSEPEKLYQTIKKILDMPNLENIWQKRRKKMLNEKIDVTQFMTWFIENYPKSVSIMEHDSSYQYKFK